MQRKKLLAIGIALALQTSYYPAMAADNTDDDVKCPANISSLSQTERDKLPAECLITKAEQDNHWGWAAGGIVALAAGVALGVHNSDSDGNSHHNVSPTPPDDGGDVTPTPPDDGGDVTPTPPDDGGDVTPTPPDDGGDITPTPPDDGGDVTPTPDDDDGDVTPTPPDDTSITTYSNGATLDRGENTLHFDDIVLDNGKHLGAATLSYSEQDSQWQLATEDGKTLNVSDWKVTDANAAVLEGSQENGLYWKYDSQGYLILADEGTQVVTSDDAVNAAQQDLTLGGEGKTGIILSGDRTQNTLSGNTNISDGAVGIVISGDETRNTLAGKATIDGGIGALISGDDSQTKISGGISVSGGGTGLVIDGENITIDNQGDSTLTGANTVGSLVIGGNAHVINDGELNVADGATGGKIIGNDAIIDNIGDSTVSGMNTTGLDIRGDRATITSEGKQTVSDNAIGIDIEGDDTLATISGGIDVTGGGTGMSINGKNARIDNTGTTTISGNGSTGMVISGDNARLNNDGELYVSDSGTGTLISGNDAVVDNTGHATIDGTGSIGLAIKGDNALVVSEGDQMISAGGTGMRIDGNDAHVTITGDISVDGAGSASTLVNGDSTDLMQAGDLLITNGATGIAVNGEENRTRNTGNAVVHDADSVGFFIAGKQNTFNNKGNITVSQNGTGAQISGTDSTITLGGDITVTAEKDSAGQFRGATGVDISGDGNATTISGNVTINGEFAQGDQFNTDDMLSGISVEGSNNTVTLDGSLSLNISKTSSDGLDAVGLNVTGDGNTVNIEQGINITYSDAGNGSSIVSGINIDGASTVMLSGDSEVDLANIPGGSQILADIQNGGQLILEDDSTLTINKRSTSQYYYDDYAILMADGEGSVIKNQGSVINNGTAAIMLASNGGLIENSGDITSYARATDSTATDAIISASGENTAAHNTSGGDITLISERRPVYSGGDAKYPLMWYENTYYAMLANNNGEVSNEAGATISLYGAGIYGVAASKGTALNAGNIYLDGFVPVLDDAGNITSSSYWSPSSLYLTSAAMVAGSTDKNQGDATATNTGTITVNNAGFGMMALNGGTAINQGTINLTADEGVTPANENQLVGMAALNGGTVINDTDGTINIEAAYGKPFLTDSSSLVINYGTICIGDNCQDSTEYNPTDSAVSLSYTDGLLSASGEDITLDNNVRVSGKVGNEGTVTVDNISVAQSGELSNSAGGVINSDISLTNGALTNSGDITGTVTSQGGTIANNGTIGSVDAEGGSTFSNDGEITDTLTVGGGSTVRNDVTGSINNVEMWKGTLDNQGYIATLKLENTTGVVSNEGTINKVNFNAATVFNNNGTVNDAAIAQGATVNNLSNGVLGVPEDMWKGTLNNWGEVDGTMNIASSAFTFYNAGTFNGSVKTASAKGGTVMNDGEFNVSGNNTVAMSASGSAKMVNNGVINLGTEGTSDTGMVAMQLESNATKDAVIENNGTINIYASDSYAFSQLGSNGHIVNNGTVYIDDSVTGSGFIKQDGKTVEGSGDGGDGTEVHYVDFTAPDEPTADVATINDTGNSGTSSSSDAANDLTGYVVGTRADGSAGQLMVSNASMNGVEINTGFTAGTADTTVTFDNVVEGSNLSDANAIQSTSVVWNAQGSTDSDGNVDVTMTKNAYADVATDGSVSDVAQALDAGYTNNELYTSLNVGTTAELNSALKQVSGAQATTVFREARILSNRFTMLADAAPQIKDGLAFNVVAKGDPRAELGNDTQYDMLALRQTLDLTASQNLTLEYGIARLDGDGSQKAGDNGLTGGYSQFFGLKHSMAFADGLAWNNSLRYDVHNLDSSRSVAYGDVNKIADSDSRQQYMEFRSEGAKTFFLMDDTLKVTPYAGVKFRHTMEDGYKERSAGDFNLSMNSGSETAVDSIVGLKMDYAGKDGWSATATLEGGPNLSYNKSQRTASLQGAAGQSFGVDDGQKGGGVNGLATIGVKYSSNDTALHLDAYQWKEDGISDKGFMLNVKKTFR
ncbi:autotransporter domain-containing protein [Salmonella enterica]|nr:autotransporter domain-containing protein [Salmonella enterica]EBP4572555.1 autotransporter domain-containing protein [Salmonella enterica]